MRKTIEVSYIVERGNYFLAHSEDEQRDERKGVASMIELALHHAGVYAGYLYLESAGINHDGWNKAWDRHRAIAEIRKANGIVNYNNGTPRWEDYCQDDTRRAYMMKGQPYPNTRVEKVAS
jgi:hypothetical protein